MYSRLRQALGATVAVALGASLIPASSAVAQGVLASAASTYSVTYVARVCDDYTDIMANRARNNIQESLRDLGQDTTYTSGSPVRPSVEDAVASQFENCRPLEDWRLTLGTGITGKTPGSLYLSTVTGAYSTSIVTQESVPELNPLGLPTGATVEGAVTVELTAAQAERAQRGSSLWLQGGTPSAPLNGLQQEYGFGALRCGIDNLNGDNVEWIGFGAQARHTFCYYYSVQPPPESAVINVRKELAPGTSGPAAFRYVGNISYTAGDDFTLQPRSSTQPASIQFVRAAGTTWDFEEQPAEGFVPTGPPTCIDSGGEGASTIAITGQRVEVNPAPGAVITCTYVNEADVTGPLSLSKVTQGGVGTFDFDVDFPVGTTNSYEVTTSEPGLPELVAEVPAGPTGPYTVTETLPADTARGSWELTSAACNGAPVAVVNNSFGGTVGLGASVACVVENTFTPGGSLAIRKTTVGGVGDFGYAVQQIDTAAGVLTGQSAAAVAEVTQEETATAAVVNEDESSLDLTALPVDEDDSLFVISELLPPRDETGRWTTRSVTCTGNTLVERSDPGGFVTVRITEQTPDVVCDFVNEFVPSGRVTLSKVAEGPEAARAGGAEIALTCTNDTNATLSLGRAESEANLEPLIFFDETSCEVDEVETGVAPDATVDTTIEVVVSGEVTQVVEGTTVEFAVQSGDEIDVRVLNVYALDEVVEPEEPGTGGGGGGGDGDGDGAGDDGGVSAGTLPNTGSDAALRLAGWAMLLVVVGAYLIGLSRLARRWQWV